MRSAQVHLRWTEDKSVTLPLVPLSHFLLLHRPVSTGPVGTVDTVRLKRVVNVMRQFLGFPNFNIDSMLMGGG